MALFKELLRHFMGYKIKWRILFFVVTLMTTVGVVLHTPTLSPYPLNNSSLSTLESVSTLQDLNGSGHLIDIVPKPTVEKLQLRPISSIAPLQSSDVRIKQPPLENRRSTIYQSNPLTKRKRKMGNMAEEIKVVLPPPPPRHLRNRLERDIWSLPPGKACAYARKEIEHAPAITDHPGLYAPVFRNVSVFKRSYELMELILKVYIYPDGAKPIFHKPHLTGIYASEGWFMRLMEGNKQFVTKNPERAHLYYLPYSARQLQQALFVPDSHNMRPLSIFLRDYVNTIAAKYPFWNRTRGSDHFLVACHDWGPYTVKEHPELMNNTIKALCNADLGDHVFIPGKDVSLPETTIRNQMRPLRYIGGGKRVSQRPILAFFAGNMHGRVRPLLLKYWSNKDEDMKIYGPLPTSIARKMSYIHHMKSSKFCICPMGFEVNSPRIIEAIYYECVPVIIADNFVLPLSDVLDWTAFSVVVAEKDIPKLKEILLAIPLKKYVKLLENVKMVQRHFIWNIKPVKYDLFHMILHSIWFNRLNQK